LIYGNTLGPGINRPVLLRNRADGSGDCNYPNQDQTTELYVWDNTDDGQPVEVRIRTGDECLFQEGRDFFYYAKPGYVPFTYPHPLLIDSAQPLAPRNLRLALGCVSPDVLLC
jgi:hypothetical protein